MTFQLLFILGLTLGILLVLSVVVTILLYRRNAKRWYWYATALIGGGSAYFLYEGFLDYSGLSRRLGYILSLVLAGLFYAVAALLYRRNGMSTKALYAFIGVAVAILLIFAFLFPGTPLGILPFIAFLSIIQALWQRARTR